MGFFSASERTYLGCPEYQAAPLIRQKIYVAVFADDTSSYSKNIRQRIDEGELLGRLKGLL